MTTRPLDLDTLTLAEGSHQPGDEMCAMEAVAWLAGEDWTDHPACASPVAGAFIRSWNDALPDLERQSLKQYIPRLVGSASNPGVESARAWMAVDWLVREYTPVWLRAAGLGGHAGTLAGLPELGTRTNIEAIRPAIDAARDAARAAAAWDAAWDAARAAARDALASAVAACQASAHQLIDRMLNTR